MGTGHGAQRYARPIAELVGVAADDTVVRYGVLSLTFLFLLAAAYLFGPAAQTQAVATLLLAVALVVFVIYWWFLEEARKRRVMLLEEQPQATDARNPDLRDEVIFVCIVLFVVTAMLLQTLNDTSLHYEVEDILGLKALVCGTQPDTFCAANARLLELPEWILFTLQSFITTVPMVDQVSDYATQMTGIRPTPDTPAFIGTGLRFILGGFFLTLVIGTFNKIGRQIDTAIEALTHTHTLAAGMGPIVIARLKKVLDDASQESRWNNGLLALGDIAQRYQRTRPEVEKLFTDCLAAKFNDIDPQTRDDAKLERLKALTTAYCAIQSERGLNMVSERIQQTPGLVYTKIKLVKTVADKLDRNVAIKFLQELDPALMSKMLARSVGNALSDLDASPADGDADAVSPAVAVSPALLPTPPAMKAPDERQGALSLADEYAPTGAR